MANYAVLANGQEVLLDGSGATSMYLSEQTLAGNPIVSTRQNGGSGWSVPQVQSSSLMGTDPVTMRPIGPNIMAGPQGGVLDPLLRGVGAVADFCDLFPSLCGAGGPTTTNLPQAPTIKVNVSACQHGFRLNQCGICVKKRRRMNPLNPKALRRSTTRLVGFTKAVKSTQKALTKACSLKVGGRGSTSRAKCGTCNKRACSCR